MNEVIRAEKLKAAAELKEIANKIIPQEDIPSVMKEMAVSQRTIQRYLTGEYVGKLGDAKRMIALFNLLIAERTEKSNKTVAA